MSAETVRGGFWCVGNLERRHRALWLGRDERDAARHRGAKQTQRALAPPSNARWYDCLLATRHWWNLHLLFPPASLSHRSPTTAFDEVLIQLKQKNKKRVLLTHLDKIKYLKVPYWTHCSLHYSSWTPVQQETWLTNPKNNFVVYQEFRRS